jgi:hypothetical protein
LFTSCQIIVKGFRDEFSQNSNYNLLFSLSIKGASICSSTRQPISSNGNKFACEIVRDTLVQKVDPSGSLILDVDISLLFVDSSPLPSQCHELIYNYKELADQHGKMLSSSDFSDFKFIVGDEEFKVHRNILAAVSGYFDNMFKSKMKEGLTNQCEVTHIEPEIFRHLLRYIYEIRLPENLDAIAMKLFEAAHYYEIDRLMEICRQRIFKQLNVENAIEFYAWALKYDENLKMKAWEIIKR